MAIAASARAQRHVPDDAMSSRKSQCFDSIARHASSHEPHTQFFESCHATVDVRPKVSLSSQNNKFESGGKEAYFVDKTNHRVHESFSKEAATASERYGIMFDDRVKILYTVRARTRSLSFYICSNIYVQRSDSLSVRCPGALFDRISPSSMFEDQRQSYASFYTPLFSFVLLIQFEFSFSLYFLPFV